MFVHASESLSVQTKSLLRFARLRAWRIYPLSSAVPILIIVLIGLDEGFRHWFQADGQGNLSTLVFLKTLILGNRWLPIRGEWNQPAWSVSVEIIGYLSFPLLSMGVMRCSRRTCMGAVAVLLVGFAVLGYAVRKVNNNDIHTWALVRMSFGFSIGAVLYRVWKLAPEIEVKYHSMIGLVCAAGVALVGVFPKTMVLIECLFSGLIYSLASQRGLINSLLSTRVVFFLGKISFPLCLLHDTTRMAHVSSSMGRGHVLLSCSSTRSTCHYHADIVYASCLRRATVASDGKAASLYRTANLSLGTTEQG